MSQNFSYIVTSQIIESSPDIIKFIVGNLTTIPINIDGYAIKKFIYHKENELKNIDINCDDENVLISKIEKILNDLEIKNYAIVHISEFADWPVNDYEAAFENSKLILESIFISEQGEKVRGDKYNKAFQLLNYDLSFIREFSSFTDAEEEFFKS